MHTLGHTTRTRTRTRAVASQPGQPGQRRQPGHRQPAQRGDRSYLQARAPPSRRRRRTTTTTTTTTRTLASSDNNADGFGIGKFLKSVQGALPVVGLVSRLATPEGGIGNDDCAYPEYCRQVYEASPLGFQEAIGDLQNKYGKSAQRKYVLLCLWMVKMGTSRGLVRDSLVVDSARRVRVSQDVEFEMERFLGEYKEGVEKYKFIDWKDMPVRGLGEQAEVAVDAMARLILPLQDGEGIGVEDQALVEDLVVGGMLGYPEAWRGAVRAAIEGREGRGARYVKAKQ